MTTLLNRRTILIIALAILLLGVLAVSHPIIFSIVVGIFVCVGYLILVSSLFSVSRLRSIALCWLVIIIMLGVNPIAAFAAFLGMGFGLAVQASVDFYKDATRTLSSNSIQPEEYVQQPLIEHIDRCKICKELLQPKARFCIKCSAPAPAKPAIGRTVKLRGPNN
jgi:hypothetical protein